MAYLITLALTLASGGALRHWGALALAEYRHGIVIQRRQRLAKGRLTRIVSTGNTTKGNN